MKKQIAVLCAVLLCLLTAFVPGAAAAAPAKRNVLEQGG